MSAIQKNTLIYCTAILVGVLVLMMMWKSQVQFTPVNDELANIPSGYNFIETGRYTDPTHPPVLRYLMAAPLYAMQADPMAADTTGEYSWPLYGSHFMFDNRPDWQTILSGARLVSILLSLGLLALVFFWARKLWGNLAGLAGVLFLAFEPTFLGHGQLATLDIGFAVMYFAATWVFWEYLKSPTWKNFWWLNLAFGLTFLSKFAAIPLYFAAIIGLVIFKRSQQLSLRRFWLTPLIQLLLVFAVYLFQVKPAEQDWQITRLQNSEKVVRKIDEVAADWGTTAADMLAVPVPAYDFWKGFGMQVFHTFFQDMWSNKDSFQYLNGEYSSRGWRTYFVWTFLYKSTLATVLFIFPLLYFSGRNVVKRFSFSGIQFSVTTYCLFIPPLLLFIACSLGTINIGHRYVLPVYPFIAMGIGFLTTLSVRYLRYLVWGLLALHVASSAVVWPHHLSYFNELSRSKHYLTDSNIDWGQDLLFLKKDMESSQVQGTTVWADCFGNVKPANLGLQVKSLPFNSADELGPGRHTIYLSVHRFLNKSIKYPNGPYPWLVTQPVSRKVGTSILVYEIEIKPRQ